MGYTASTDMHQQVKLQFKTREDAIAYAKKNNLVFDVIEPKEKKRIPASYAANFANDRKGTWTH